MPTGLPQPVPVTEGGTGAKTDNDARINLGIGYLTASDGSSGESLNLDLSELTDERSQKAVDGDGIIPLLIWKDTTGDPASGQDGNFAVNTFDHTLKFWASGAWRSVTITW